MPSEIAVLMAAYNSEATIREAVRSVTASTHPCDLFIIDDCSRVPVSDFLGAVPNVEIIRLARNQGPAGASNAGLREILQRPYKYVAKMDADDISYPDRFAKQVAFLEKHPNIGAVGCWGRRFNEKTGETTFVHRAPVTPDDVERFKFFNSPMSNSSAMVRAEVFREMGLYSTDYPAAEDYEIFRRFATRYELANIPEILLDICESINGISLSKRRRQVYDRLRIQIKYFEPLQWRAWAGVAKTLLLFVVPRKIVASIKILFESVFFTRTPGKLKNGNVWF